MVFIACDALIAAQLIYGTANRLASGASTRPYFVLILSFVLESNPWTCWPSSKEKYIAGRVSIPSGMEQPLSFMVIRGVRYALDFCEARRYMILLRDYDGVWSGSSLFPFFDVVMSVSQELINNY